MLSGPGVTVRAAKILCGEQSSKKCWHVSPEHSLSPLSPPTKLKLDSVLPGWWFSGQVSCLWKTGIYRCLWCQTCWSYCTHQQKAHVCRHLHGTLMYFFHEKSPFNLTFNASVFKLNTNNDITIIIWRYTCVYTHICLLYWKLGDLGNQERGATI